MQQHRVSPTAEPPVFPQKQLMRRRWLGLLQVRMITFFIGFIDRTNVRCAMPSVCGELVLTSTEGCTSPGL